MFLFAQFWTLYIFTHLYLVCLRPLWRLYLLLSNIMKVWSDNKHLSLSRSQNMFSWLCEAKEYFPVSLLYHMYLCSICTFVCSQTILLQTNNMSYNVFPWLYSVLGIQYLSVKFCAQSFIGHLPYDGQAFHMYIRLLKAKQRKLFGSFGRIGLLSYGFCISFMVCYDTAT